MPYVEYQPARKLGGKFVLMGSDRGRAARNMRGDFVRLNTPVPYSSLAGMGGRFVNYQIMRPPYRSGVNAPLSGLGAASPDQIRNLCATHPDICSRFCASHPDASIFFRTACAAPPMAGYLGLGDTVTPTDVAASTSTDPVAVAPSTFSTELTSAEDWLKANPILAAGIGIAAFMLLFGGGRGRR